MPTPIRRENGQFNGSTASATPGAGGRNVPTAPPTAAAPAPVTTAVEPPLLLPTPGKVHLPERVRESLWLTVTALDAAVAERAALLGLDTHPERWDLGNAENVAFSEGALRGQMTVRDLLTQAHPGEAAAAYALEVTAWETSDDLTRVRADLDAWARRGTGETEAVQVDERVLRAFEVLNAVSRSALDAFNDELDMTRDDMWSQYDSDDDAEAFSETVYYAGMASGMRRMVAALQDCDDPYQAVLGFAREAEEWVNDADSDGLFEHDHGDDIAAARRHLRVENYVDAGYDLESAHTAAYLEFGN